MRDEINKELHFTDYVRKFTHFLKNICTYQTHNYVFLLKKKNVIKNMIPNTYFVLEIFETRVFTTFFKLQFSHYF